MIDVLDMWKDPALRPDDPRPIAREAMGFVDLAGEVVGLKTSVRSPNSQHRPGQQLEKS